MTTIQDQRSPPQANFADRTTTTMTPQHTQTTHVNIIEDKPFNHLQQRGPWTTSTSTTRDKQPLETDEVTTETQAPITDNKHRLTYKSRNTYRESRTHGLIIEHPDRYTLDTNKYHLNDLNGEQPGKTY